MGDVENVPVLPVYHLRGPFHLKEANCWTCRLPPEMEEDGDGNGSMKSQWQLLEDGTVLGPSHASHREIIELGKGRYSHWHDALWFSSSDNTNPNGNGRRYGLRWCGTGSKAWLAKLAAANVVDVFPFGPRDNVKKCSGAIAIFGSSFCGSTLLNAVLGAHPLIYGGAELEWLHRDKLAGSVCAICGSGCTFWTSEARASITTENFYDEISRIFGRPFIADSSKGPFAFDPVLTHFPELPVVRILLVKHPVRHVASIMEKKATVGNLPGGLPYSSWDRAVYGLRLFYEYFSLPSETDLDLKYTSPKTPRTRVDFTIRYEDFVESPAAALRPVLAKLGLDYHPRMEQWADTEHHHIGGNIGPRVQISNEQAVLPAARKKYRQRGIFLDNSYADILDLDTIENVLRDPDALWMRQRFGYAAPE